MDYDVFETCSAHLTQAMVPGTAECRLLHGTRYVVFKAKCPYPLPNGHA